MLVLEADLFVRLIRSIDADYNWEDDGPFPDEELVKLNGLCDYIINILKGFDLSHSIKVVDKVVRQSRTSADIPAKMKELSRSIELELDGSKFYGPLRAYAKYYDQPNLFGDAVFNHFPSANDDIFEAGACLALERATACVMHLMRVLETGLAALAKSVGITNQNDWGAYLRKIQDELDRRTAAAGARPADEQFYAEAASNFDRLRRAFRNPTMHPEKTYSQDRAEEILLSTKSFMNHLATRISEI